MLVSSELYPDGVAGELSTYSTRAQFTLSGLPAHKSLNGVRFNPDRIEFLYIDGKLSTVTLSGPGLLKNGQPAARRAKSIFGVGGWPLVDLYDWAINLMVQADTYNVGNAPQAERRSL